MSCSRVLIIPARSWSQITVLFTDIVQFTHMAGQMDPSEVIVLLNTLFSKFDNLLDEFMIYKVCPMLPRSGTVL